MQKAFCTAYACGVLTPTRITRKSMTSTQGALCLNHCKVQTRERVVLPAAVHTAAPCLHVIPITSTA